MTDAEIIETYGDPFDPQFERNRIVFVQLPYHLVFLDAMVRRVRCHELVATSLREIFEEIFDAGLEGHATHYAGIYALRKQRQNSNRLSAHSWGIAIDLNAERLPQGSELDQHSGVVEIFKKHGWYYGGDFKPLRDPMHMSAIRR